MTTAPTKCPVCHKILPTEATELCDKPGVYNWEPEPLYQRSYPGEKRYISPRCSDCYDSIIKRGTQ